MPSAVSPQLLGGRYELLRQIGAGGMATVWEANDLQLRRCVAVKILHPHLRSTDMLARFREEGRATAQLRHPGIVTVFDTISTSDCEAIVMELVTGRTLRDVLDRRPMLPLDRALDVAIALADALDAAHRAGVLHRDIKPANVLIGATGTVKLTDFGIAKRTRSADLTRTGTVLGTARYLAPEQLEGRRADARSDIYSLATVLYEMLCGVTPFTGESETAVALARLHSEPVPATQHRRDIPRNLDAALQRALARNPDERFATAAHLRTALVAVRARTPNPAAPPPRPPERTAIRATVRTRDDTTVQPLVADPPEPTDRVVAPLGAGTVVARLLLITMIVTALVIAAVLIGTTHTGAQLLQKIGLR